MPRIPHIQISHSSLQFLQVEKCFPNVTVFSNLSVLVA